MRLFRVIALSVLLAALASCGKGEGSSETSGNDETEIPYADGFTVSNVFSSDMVVQRGENIRVWGWADPSQNGKRISGEFLDMCADAIISDGKWELVFPPVDQPISDFGHDMRIFAGSASVVFTDVLVGDVYIASGQSNFAYSVETYLMFDGGDVTGNIDCFDYSAPIRLHYSSLTQTDGYPRRGTEEVCEQTMSGEKWKRADSYAAIKDFSAIGYLTAAKLVKLSEGVPVGIIGIDGNGQPLGAFMSNSVAEKMKTDVYDPETDRYVTTGVNADAGRYMYNHYMYPFERYPIAGMIWYQGESDFQTDNALRYPDCFGELISYMRGTHNLINRDFPVFFVEFPPIFQRSESAASEQWAYLDLGLIRATMGSLTRKIGNCYQVISCDLFSDSQYWNSLHPNIKESQSQRLAELIMSVNGYLPSESSYGPNAVGITLTDEGKTAVITYENVGSGLAVYGDGELRGFTLCNSDGIPDPSLPFTATVSGKNTVTVRSDTVISGIAYNCISDAVFGVALNLVGGMGFPAGATYFDCRTTE